MSRESEDLNTLTMAVANCPPRIRARAYAALAGKEIVNAQAVDKLKLR